MNAKSAGTWNSFWPKGSCTAGSSPASGSTLRMMVGRATRNQTTSLFARTQCSCLNASSPKPTLRGNRWRAFTARCSSIFSTCRWWGCKCVEICAEQTRRWYIPLRGFATAAPGTGLEAK